MARRARREITPPAVAVDRPDEVVRGLDEVTEVALALPQALLDPLAIGDVDDRADEPDRAAAGVAHGVALGVHPHVGAVRPPQPAFLVERRAAVDCRIHRRHQPPAVLGMETVGQMEDADEVDVRCVAEDLLEAVGHVAHAAHDVPVPQTALRRLDRELEALLAFAQRGIGALALGDVGVRHDVAEARAGLPGSACPDMSHHSAEPSLRRSSSSPR